LRKPGINLKKSILLIQLLDKKTPALAWDGIAFVKNVRYTGKPMEGIQNFTC
jgi:hypothetical protein